MKEVVIISGKGGAGKTTVSAALNYIAKRNVSADADVEAANLQFLLGLEEEYNKTPFIGMKRAEIDPDLCTNCGLCQEACVFNSIIELEDQRKVITSNCEGCTTCTYVCPEHAISMKEHQAGDIHHANTTYGKDIFYADLYLGEENTGMLVSKVRSDAQEFAKANEFDWLIVDGPPGTGCPATSAITGCDFVLVVVEASVAGVADFNRTLDLIDNFRIKRAVVINKYDINEEMTSEIHKICENRIAPVPIIGKIPYSTEVQLALADQVPINKYDSEDIVSIILNEVWNKLIEIIDVEQMQFDADLSLV